jgi:hypothetical protein
VSVTILANNGAGTSTPIDVVAPYSAEDVGRSVVHNLIGGGIAVSLVAPNLRNGTVRYRFNDVADAAACRELHREVTTFTLTATDMPDVDMDYIVTSIQLEQSSDALLWDVLVGFQEVEP